MSWSLWVALDDGVLTKRLINDLLKDGVVKVVSADGPTAVWGLTEKGREIRSRLGYP